MTIREQIVAEAKTWEGTPYHDFAGVKGAGVDCAFFPLRVYQAVGLIEPGFTPPWYSPQQWLNSPEQTDRMKLRVVDHTFEDVVLKFAHKEITEAEVKPGDFIIVKIAASWTHGGIVVSYPEYILHPIKGRGVIGSHRNEGFWKRREMRFFTVVKDE